MVDSILGNTVHLFSRCIVALFQKRSRRAGQHVHALARADVLAVNNIRLSAAVIIGM